MALTQRLQLRQSQALVMTPQLMQAIKLLQLSNLDLVAYVEAELERNPLLDRSNPDGETAPGAADGAPSTDKPPENGTGWEGTDGDPPSAIEQERADKSLDPTSPHASGPGRGRTILRRLIGRWRAVRGAG